MTDIGFENGIGIVKEQGGGVKLTVTSDKAHSGKNSLLVTGRTERYMGAKIEINEYIKPDTFYEVTAWVLSKTPQSADLRLEAYSSAGWSGIDSKTVSAKDGWTKLTGEVYFGSAILVPDLALYISSEDKYETAEYYINDISLEESSRNDAINNAAKLPSLKDIYKKHFMIGGTFGSENLNGATLPFILY
jgi:hypothetical protein